VRTNRGRRFVYSAETIASPAGRYAFRLPYANDGGPRSVRVEAHYTLHCGDEQALVAVDEQAVATGAQRVGPSLCPAGERPDPQGPDPTSR
jgi:hypothetical protein